MLDKFGGTDIYQMPISQVEITKGVERMNCIKLKPKGLIRWYAGCCRTPIGNTISSNIPFIGVIHSFMDDAGVRDKNIGLVHEYMCTKDSCLAERKKTSSFKIIVRILLKMLVWKVKGLNKPSSFFDSNGPVSTPLLIEPNIGN